MSVDKIIEKGTFKILNRSGDYLGLLLFTVYLKDPKVNGAELKIPVDSQLLKSHPPETRFKNVHYFKYGEYECSDIWSYSPPNSDDSKTFSENYRCFKELKKVEIQNFEIPKLIRDALKNVEGEYDKWLIRQVVRKYL